MRTQRLAFMDLETTGLRPDRHEILEIGLVLAEQGLSGDKKINLSVIESFGVKVKPTHLETADPVALKVCHYNEADWALAVSLDNALRTLAEKTKGAIMVGQNVAFDFAFLEHNFEKCGIENQMHYHKLDTISIAYSKLYGQEEVDKLSLRVLCEYLGVKNERAHSALSDARATYAVFKKLMEM